MTRVGRTRSLAVVALLLLLVSAGCGTAAPPTEITVRPIEEDMLAEPSHDIPPVPVRPTWPLGLPSSRGFVDPSLTVLIGPVRGWELSSATADLRLRVTDDDPSMLGILRGEALSGPTPITMLAIEGEEYVVAYQNVQHWCVVGDGPAPTPPGQPPEARCRSVASMGRAGRGNASMCWPASPG